MACLQCGVGDLHIVEMTSDDLLLWSGLLEMQTRFRLNLLNGVANRTLLALICGGAHKDKSTDNISKITVADIIRDLSLLAPPWRKNRLSVSFILPPPFYYTVCAFETRCLTMSQIFCLLISDFGFAKWYKKSVDFKDAKVIVLLDLL